MELDAAVLDKINDLTLAELLDLLPYLAEIRKLSNGWRVSLKNDSLEREEEDYQAAPTIESAIREALKMALRWDVNREQDFCPWCLFPSDRGHSQDFCNRKRVAEKFAVRLPD